jgi:hypothetical protein
LSSDAIMAWANHQAHQELDWIPLHQFIHYRGELGL